MTFQALDQSVAYIDLLRYFCYAIVLDKSFKFSFILCFSPYKIWNIFLCVFLLFTFGITNWSIYFSWSVKYVLMWSFVKSYTFQFCWSVILCYNGFMMASFISFFWLMMASFISGMSIFALSQILRDEPSNLKPWMEFIDNLIITSFNICIISSRIV